MSCRLLGVSRSGYYEWAANVPSARAKQDAELVERIIAIHGAHRAELEELRALRRENAPEAGA
jgi:hypothetical protein